MVLSMRYLPAFDNLANANIDLTEIMRSQLFFWGVCFYMGTRIQRDSQNSEEVGAGESSHFV